MHGSQPGGCRGDGPGGREVTDTRRYKIFSGAVLNHGFAFPRELKRCTPQEACGDGCRHGLRDQLDPDPGKCWPRAVVKEGGVGEGNLPHHSCTDFFLLAAPILPPPTLLLLAIETRVLQVVVCVYVGSVCHTSLLLPNPRSSTCSTAPPAAARPLLLLTAAPRVHRRCS